MVLHLHALHGDQQAKEVVSPQGRYSISVVWPPILPSDRTELVQQETALVNARIHSRRRALDLLGETDSDTEWERVLEERREE